MIQSCCVLALFSGSSTPEQEIELMHAERAWYFFLTWAKVETGKRVKVASNLLHVYSYQGVNIIHTERRMQSWLNNAQKVAFLF